MLIKECIFHYETELNEVNFEFGANKYLKVKSVRFAINVVIIKLLFNIRMCKNTLEFKYLIYFDLKCEVHEFNDLNSENKSLKRV